MSCNFPADDWKFLQRVKMCVFAKKFAILTGVCGCILNKNFVGKIIMMVVLTFVTFDYFCGERLK